MGIHPLTQILLRKQICTFPRTNRVFFLVIEIQSSQCVQMHVLCYKKKDKKTKKKRLKYTFLFGTKNLNNKSIFSYVFFFLTHFSMTIPQLWDMLPSVQWVILPCVTLRFGEGQTGGSSQGGNKGRNCLAGWMFEWMAGQLPWLTAPYSSFAESHCCTDSSVYPSAS